MQDLDKRLQGGRGNVTARPKQGYFHDVLGAAHISCAVEPAEGPVAQEQEARLVTELQRSQSGVQVINRLAALVQLGKSMNILEAVARLLPFTADGVPLAQRAIKRVTVGIFGCIVGIGHRIQNVITLRHQLIALVHQEIRNHPIVPGTIEIVRRPWK